MNPPELYRITAGTRGSALALWQTNYVIAALKQLEPRLSVDIRIVKTEGDKDQVRPLAELGGLGVFTKTIEDALLAGEIDLAVHSLKDLPTETAAGLVIAAIPERQDPRDAVISRHGLGLMQLPPGARVGTSSARRAAQVLALRPDVQIVPLRGNVDTRLRKARTEEYDAIILAAAGLVRLGRGDEITEYLSIDQFLPDPGQGALAVEIRAGDAALAALVGHLDNHDARVTVTAERTFLQALGGGCRLPIGAYAELHGEILELHGVRSSEPGAGLTHGKVVGQADQAKELGAQLAAQLMVKSTLSSGDTLRGKRILVTRAREQAEAIALKIRALGGEAVEFPTIDFAPLEDFRELDDTLARVGEFDWAVFTSANGVRGVAERLAQLGSSPEIFGKTRLAAIGPATARALEHLKLRVDFIPTKFLGEQIAVELPAQAGERVLLLRADIASDALARGLTDRGIRVMDVNAYRTVQPNPMPGVPLERIDAVTFTSSSTVRHFVEMVSVAHNDLDRVAVFCIGPVTAATARESGLVVTGEATEHTIDGLVAIMARYYMGL